MNHQKWLKIKVHSMHTTYKATTTSHALVMKGLIVQWFLFISTWKCLIWYYTLITILIRHQSLSRCFSLSLPWNVWYDIILWLLFQLGTSHWVVLWHHLCLQAWQPGCYSSTSVYIPVLPIRLKGISCVSQIEGGLYRGYQSHKPIQQPIAMISLYNASGSSVISFYTN